MLYKLCCGVCALCFSSAVWAQDAQESERRTFEPVQKEQLLHKPQSSVDEITVIRRKMIEDAAYTVGFRGGWQNKSLLLVDMLEARAPVLDVYFQFSTLISRDGVLPAVVTEGIDASSIADKQIRTASRVYSIVKEEQFVSVPPTWRDYLFMGLANDSYDGIESADVYPENDTENAIWEDAIEQGWEDGQEEARYILRHNINRLTRDYVGMMTYLTLVKRNMIDTPIVDTAYQIVEADDTRQSIKIDNRHKMITQGSQFNLETQSWEPIIRSSRFSGSLND